jgi:hypothetical protein
MSSNGTISPMELESLAAQGDSSNKPTTSTLDRLSMMVRLYYELYPKTVLAGCACAVGVVLFWWSPTLAGGHSMRNYMTHDYTALEDNFSFKSAQIDHWCLFGGDDKCYCEGTLYSKHGRIMNIFLLCYYFCSNNVSPTFFSIL